MIFFFHMWRKHFGEKLPSKQTVQTAFSHRVEEVGFFEGKVSKKIEFRGGNMNQVRKRYWIECLFRIRSFLGRNSHCIKMRLGNVDVVGSIYLSFSVCFTLPQRLNDKIVYLLKIGELHIAFLFLLLNLPIIFPLNWLVNWGANLAI